MRKGIISRISRNFILYLWNHSSYELQTWYDIFRPEVLKMCIARIACGSYMPCCPVDGHNLWPDLEKPFVCDFFWNLSLMYEFDVWLIRSSIELTGVQVLRQLRASLWRYSALRSRYTPIIEKLQSKGGAMHAYSVSGYYAWTGNQLNGPGWGRLKQM